MSHSAFNWKQPAGKLLEAALNRAVALDAQTRDALADLQGRHIALHLANPPLALQISVDNKQLRVGPVAAADTPDLAVRTGLTGLLAQLPMFKNANNTITAQPKARLRIEGDAALAQQLQQLAAGFDPDWQRPFTQVFGDIIGVQIANAIAAALRNARVLAVQAAHTGASYLTEEAQVLVSSAEQAAFFDDVDTLRDDVERLAARVARMQARHGAAR